MKTSIMVDEELVAKAKEVTGIADTSALMSEALRTLIAREAARQLIRLGGSAPGTIAAPRRRFKFSFRERLRILIKG